jgi:hypothetical protein
MYELHKWPKNERIVAIYQRDNQVKPN